MSDSGSIKLSEGQLVIPDHLSTASAAWLRTLADEFDLEEHHARLAILAAESWDRAQQAREEIVSAGAYYVDRFGQPRAHPAIAVERDAQIRFARLVRELQLEDPAPEPRLPRGTS